MLRKLPFQFGIRTSVFQVHYSSRLPSRKYAWIRPMTIYHFEGSCDSSRVAICSQDQRLFAFTPDVPSDLCRRRWGTAPVTSSSSGTN